MSFTLEQVTADCTEDAYKLTEELIAYHGMLDIFTMTQERYAELVSSGSLVSFTVSDGGKPFGVMNFFYKLTTFTGRKILYIEDLYVRKEYRGSGAGRMLMKKAAETAAENDCEEIELKCACWNKDPAEFYKSCGMTENTAWNTFTMSNSSFDGIKEC